MARLDKVAFASSPCLWPKALQDLILALRCFPPGPHHQKNQTNNSVTTAFPPPNNPSSNGLARSAANLAVRRKAVCSSLAQRRMASSGSAAHLSLSPPPAPWHKWDRAACTPGIALFVTGAVRNGSPPCPARSGQQPSTAEHPRHCPRSPPSPEICRKQRVVPACFGAAGFQSNCSCHG